MYVPSFSISKILFISSALLDLFTFYILLYWTVMPSYCTYIFTLLVFAAKIPLYKVIFQKFNRNAIYWSFIGLIVGLAYSTITILLMFINIKLYIFFVLLIIFLIANILSIILKIILIFNIFILRSFLIFDVTIPSNFSLLHAQEKIGAFTSGFTSV